MSSDSRLIIVSNRLPVTLECVNGRIDARPSSGGLVSALLPAFRESGGCWIGWPGTGFDDVIASALRGCCAPVYSLEPVFLDEREVRCFYHGWSNEIIWPLFHDLQSNCNFDPDYWAAYREATEKFADAVERIAAPRDFVWVHDYHLMMLAGALHSRGVRARLAYFHHIPFPSPDIFEKLPWRTDILGGLLKFHFLGFQTTRDRANFAACVSRCFPDAQVEQFGERLLVRASGSCASAGVYPVSVDYQALASDAANPEVERSAAAIRQSLRGRKMLFGLDRLDYTKGLLQRIAGFRTLLRREPSLKGMVSLLQVVVPSRELIPRYRELSASVERLISEVNGEFGIAGWTPVEYWRRCVPMSELLALYRAADVAFLTPLRDGMNLVAKEFCAARVDEVGVLVLSEFAGAAEELKRAALLVNPYDVEGMAGALLRALQMDLREQRVRMRMLRQAVQAADVFEWCRRAWSAAAFGSPRSSPPALPAESVPRFASAV